MANGDSPATRGTLSTLLLSAAIAALAIAVAILAWIVFGRLDDLLTKDEFRERMDAVDAAHEAAHKEVIERIKKLEQIIGDCCNETTKTTKITNPRVELMFDNARLGFDTAGAPLDELSEESSGIALSEPQRKKLDKLADALVACATLDAKDKVHLKVQGYSSTRPFMDGGRVRNDSDLLNKDAANLRAEVVIARLDIKVSQASNIHVDHEPWDQYADIERPFKDLYPLGTGETDQEQLNRVVYIDLKDAGRCQRTIT